MKLHNSSQKASKTLFLQLSLAAKLKVSPLPFKPTSITNALLFAQRAKSQMAGLGIASLVGKNYEKKFYPTHLTFPRQGPRRGKKKGRMF
jgi:hypothetical protein